MDKKQPVGKTIAVAYGAVLAFAAAYLVGGILLEKASRKQRDK
ncbi:hypothetical protein [Tengunoibacter tsumagoiensis]|uniref:Uncharacterized protein n=1 Tax=Tengunoibacter tsumagoiensis TaxID=2014871 RepID=A0A402A8P0_9CHLR|nr:hypothetical protein [Tengunoibacter tsumagoiensis]GCE15522.1 hypothetical protein KTT_53810 [Tengunoibacter tsumagoiensis]